MPVEAWQFSVSVGLFIVAFLISYPMMPWLIDALRRAGLTGKDLHKQRSMDVPSIGGIGIFVGFAASMTLAALLNLDYRLLFAIFLSGTLAVLSGLIDDLFRLSKKTLILVTFLCGLPVITFHAGSTLITLTPFGPLDLGVLFWVLVPLAFAFLMNGVNIYAGFNGLEAGLGIVSSLSLGICALVYGSVESAVSLFAVSGALVAFLRWNWFPARIFIGGSGTCLLGAVLASSIIAGTIKVVGVIVLFPYIVNFILRGLDRFVWTVGETLPDGSITSTKRNALWAIFMFKSRQTELRVVQRCLWLQALFGILGISYAYYTVYILHLSI